MCASPLLAQLVRYSARLSLPVVRLAQYNAPNVHVVLLDSFPALMDSVTLDTHSTQLAAAVISIPTTARISAKLHS